MSFSREFSLHNTFVVFKNCKTIMFCMNVSPVETDALVKFPIKINASTV